MPESRAEALPARSLTRAIVMLAYATAVIVATEFIVVGLLPMMARDLEVSLAEAGLFVTWFALASAILGPILTIAVSRIEPRSVLVAALLAFGFGNLVATLVPNYDASFAELVDHPAGVLFLRLESEGVFVKFPCPGNVFCGYIGVHRFIRIHAIDIVQPPGIGIPPIADMDAHRTIVTAVLAAKSSAETPKNARSGVRSEDIRREISRTAVMPRQDFAQRLSYSSWRRHQTPVSLRPLGARSSQWYTPKNGSTPRA
jgi:hypothetical protein